MKKTLQQLKDLGDAPDWLSEEALLTLQAGYLLKNETPIQMYRRVAKSSAFYLKRPDLESKFFDAMTKNWLCLSTPCAANAGTERGLPISCYCQDVQDTVHDIFQSFVESSTLIKHGGGIGKYWGNIRPAGAHISGGGESAGIVPWIKCEEAMLQSCGQGGTRRGAGASYYDIEKNDIHDFLDLRKITGDASRRCLSASFHHGVVIGDEWMESMLAGDVEKRKLWQKILKTRMEQGEPFLAWRGAMNKHLPQGYINNNLSVKSSNLCTEIFLHIDEKHSFVCCLSSLNLARFDEWENTDLIETAIYFLDGIMEEFIQKANHIKGFEKTVAFAVKSRALGLGVLGYHSYLQNKMLPFDSFDSMKINAKIFSKIHREAYAASKKLAQEYGEPEWNTGVGMRNTHCIAIAPTSTNSILSNASEGIQPIVANYYAQKSAKGTFIRKNAALEKYLQSIDKDTFEVWAQINSDSGSVKNLDFMPKKIKEIFRTAREINQFALIKQAGQRQKWIDQGQSLNLFFQIPKNLNDENEKRKLAKYISGCHIQAYKEGLKSLYYFKGSAVLKGDGIYRTENKKNDNANVENEIDTRVSYDESECIACEG